MIEIVRPSRIERMERYCLTFERRDQPGAGLSFDCYPNGTLKPFPCALAAVNYERCTTGAENVSGPRLLDYSYNYRHAAVGRCYCGAEVELDSFTNTCEACGREYNSAGQELAPRSQWGEETGEYPADIGRIR